MKLTRLFVIALLVLSVSACSVFRQPPPAPEEPQDKPAPEPRPQWQAPAAMMHRWNSQPVSQYRPSINFGDFNLSGAPLDTAVLNRGTTCKRQTGKRSHVGLDLHGKPGDPVYAGGDGTIVEMQLNHSYGKTILIDHGAISADGETHIYTRYGHLSQFSSAIEPGKKVYQGTRIGTIGRTGRATGNHLHYEILKGQCSKGNCYFSSGLLAYQFFSDNNANQWCRK